MAHLLQTSANLATSANDAYPPPYGMTFKPAKVVLPVRREIYGGGRVIDISHRFHSDDGVGTILTIPKNMKDGEPAYNSEIKLPAHVGTHVDAPGHVFDHYFEAGFDVDTLDLDVLNGTIGDGERETHSLTWSVIGILQMQWFVVVVVE